MNIQRVREIARERGLDPGKAGKAELIRAIQIKEGTRLFCRPMPAHAIKPVAGGARIVLPRSGAKKFLTRTMGGE